MAVTVERWMNAGGGGWGSGEAVMASADGTRQGLQRQSLAGMPSMSPLSETLWRDRTNTENVGDTSARLTWVDLWVTVHTHGAKQAILQGLTGTPHQEKAI